MTKARRFVPVAVSLLVVAGCGGDDGGSGASDTTAAEVTVTTIAAGANFDGVVPVAGHDVHLLCQGQGTPTVMIEMDGPVGIGLEQAQTVLAESQRTCVYERAGTGESEPGEEPRTAQAIADELHELIETAGLETPIVLLSHSLGGLDAEAFAQQYPDEVAGLVFVEPPGRPPTSWATETT